MSHRIDTTHLSTLLLAGLLLMGGSYGSGLVRADDAVLDDPDQEVYWNRPPSLPDAEEVLAAVRSALPREPLDIQARLQSKSRSGTLEREYHADIYLDWIPATPSAEYTLRDAFGASLERLQVRHNALGEASYHYFTGDPLESAAVPDLFVPIQDSDITWMDLTLSFLWWPGGTTVGAQKIRGRFCYIIDIPVPGGAEADVAGVRLWVDPKVHVLLRATTYNRSEEPVRSLDVKSLKKVGELWVVKDIEIRSFPSRHKTLLRVDTVEKREAENPAATGR